VTGGPALACYARDEALIFSKWCSYYAQHFDPGCVYLFDDGSLDGTPDIARSFGFNVERVPGDGSYRLGQPAGFGWTKARCTRLLDDHACFLLADADDFLVPREGTLRGHLDAFCNGTSSFACVRGLEAVQDLDGEPALDPTLPWMQQRRHLVHVPKFDNPTLWKVAPRWEGSFHRLDLPRPPSNGSLACVSTHHIDIGICERRHSTRNAWKERGFDLHYPVGEELRRFFRMKLACDPLIYRDATAHVVPDYVKTAF
jgi:hypothetical protein